jgi:putative endonuclease
MASSREIGLRGEAIAQDYLKKHGYKIVLTNYRCRFGEIDIIAQEKSCLVFIEVRARSSDDFGTPEETITPRKKDKLIKSASYYLSSHNNLPPLIRFDFIGITMVGKGPQINLIKNFITDVIA